MLKLSYKDLEVGDIILTNFLDRKNTVVSSHPALIFRIQHSADFGEFDEFGFPRKKTLIFCVPMTSYNSGEAQKILKHSNSVIFKVPTKNGLQKDSILSVFNPVIFDISSEDFPPTFQLKLTKLPELAKTIDLFYTNLNKDYPITPSVFSQKTVGEPKRLYIKKFYNLL